MKKEEALELLKNAPRGNKPSRINPSLTQAQAVEIVENGILSKPSGAVLDRIFELRVYQVARNQRRPKF